MKQRVRILSVAIVLATLPATGWAQDATTLLNTVTQTMGAADVGHLSYSASGSGYTFLPDGSHEHARITSYTKELDLNARTSRAQWVRQQGTPPSEQRDTLTATTSSPWPEQAALWFDPYMFLKGALAGQATLAEESIFGTTYQVVSFAAQDHRVSGYITPDHLVDRVRATAITPGPDDVTLEATFRNYKDFGGRRLPTLIIERRNDAVSRILVVNSVTP